MNDDTATLIDLRSWLLRQLEAEYPDGCTVGSAIEFYGRRKAYRATLAELQRLSSRSLRPLTTPLPYRSGASRV